MRHTPPAPPSRAALSALTPRPPRARAAGARAALPLSVGAVGGRGGRGARAALPLSVGACGGRGGRGARWGLWAAGALCAGGALACGAPPPAPRALAPTWGALTPEVTPAPAPARGRIEMELWLRDAERPDLKEVEERLAAASVLAGLNSTAEGLRVELGEARCEARWGAAPPPARGERVAACAPSLDAARAALLGGAAGLARVSCEVEGLDAAVAARAVAAGLARGREAVWALPSAGLCAAPARPAAFVTAEFVVVRALPAPAGEVALCTRGLGAFGRPELCFAGVVEAREAVAREALLAAADESLRGAPLVAGAPLSRGPARGLLTPVSVAAERLAPLRATLSGAPAGALLLTPGDGRVDDSEALRRLMMRFTAGG